MYRCSSKYDLNMAFENEISTPEVGLGHSLKDRYVKYKGKKEPISSYDKEPLLQI